MPAIGMPGNRLQVRVEHEAGLGRGHVPCPNPLMKIVGRKESAAWTEAQPGTRTRRLQAGNLVVCVYPPKGNLGPLQAGVKA